MKQIILTTALLFVFLTTGLSQKICHVDTEYILGKVPAYQDAQKKIEELSKNWQKEIENKFAEVDQMYKKYQTEKVLLSQEMQTKREEEVIAKEKEAKELQKKYFGREGDLYQKRQELIKPIQDNLYNVIKEIAAEGGYDYILDKITGDIIYASEKYDESDAVLKKMGY